MNGANIDYGLSVTSRLSYRLWIISTVSDWWGSCKHSEEWQRVGYRY